MGVHDQIVEYQWSGKTRYRCPFCYFDAPVKVDIKVHINATHVEAGVIPRRLQTTLYDADGQLVEYMPSSAGQKELLDMATEATIERRE